MAPNVSVGRKKKLRPHEDGGRGGVLRAPAFR
jgi:hypothetical protein